jgi:hypothetical protein
LLKCKINISEFEAILISLSAYIKREEYKMIVNEVSELNSEIISKHYTSAALRIGRTLEYVIYTLAMAWDVKINRVSSAIAKDLEQSNTQLTKLIIDYFYSTEEEKIRKKEVLTKKCQEVSGKITAVGFKIDNLDEPKETNQPINLQTILRDIKQKFSHIENARHILDSIIGGLPMQVLLEMRNTAAHAKIREDQSEINEENISDMTDYLKSIIFDLVNLSAIIKEKGG